MESKENGGNLNVSAKKRVSDIMTKSIPKMARKFSMLLTPVKNSSESKFGPDNIKGLSRSAQAKKYDGKNLTEFHTEVSSEEDDDPYDYGLTEDQTPFEFEQKHYWDKKVRTLKDGEHFGEIALLT